MTAGRAFFRAVRASPQSPSRRSPFERSSGRHVWSPRRSHVIGSSAISRQVASRSCEQHGPEFQWHIKTARFAIPAPEPWRTRHRRFPRGPFDHEIEIRLRSRRSSTTTPCPSEERARLEREHRGKPWSFVSGPLAVLQRVSARLGGRDAGKHPSVRVGPHARGPCLLARSD